jgi:LysR family transcriptional regulator, regulator for bpeEF and oprC
MDMDSAFRVFVRVAETESFSLAARQMGIGQPAVSKHVSTLEAHLGARLLHRTTRSITLTDEGREFLSHARRAVAATDFALERVQKVKGQASGLLRLSCQTGFARMQVVPRLTEILDTFPDLDIDLVLQDSWPNLVEQGIDLRIHIGEIEDETVITQLIGYSPIKVYAADSYIQKHGFPQTPPDLEKYQIIHFTGFNKQRHWNFIKDGKHESIELKGRLGIDNLDALREAVLCGVGITTGPEWMFKDDMDKRAVIPLLPDYEMGKVALYAAYPSRRFVPQKVRVFIDYLRSEYRKYEADQSTCRAC